MSDVSKQQMPRKMPAELDAVTETNGWLRKIKAARQGKWKLTAAKSLWELSDLACALTALGRADEAIAIPKE